MSLTMRVLVALVAGLALGVGVSVADSAMLTTLAQWVEPLGTLFINAIRMTIIPLVVSSLIVGVTSAPDTRTIGRLGGRALVFMLVSLAIACSLGVLAAGPAFSMLSIDPAASAALRASASAGVKTAGTMPSFGQWLVDLVPANPIKSAADGAMLPLIIFSIAFGVALSHIETRRRASVVRFFEGILDASITLVRWVLTLAPMGVFALAVPLAARMGLSAAGALATYIAVVSVLTTVLIVLLYPVAVIGGRMKLRTFARAALPAQAMAFSGRSSLAALPAMITATRDTLALPPQIAGFLVPLLTATFRIGAGVGQTVPIVFIAHLYGISLGPAQLATIAVTAVIVSFSVPGIPGGTIIAMVPVLMAAGLPIEGAGIMLGVDTIPDMFRTTANVTGDLTAAVVLGRGENEVGA
ncbi:MAG: dicarboxylate/amino acid:cation symporter [Gemmatimonadaceae bacterium]|nr:dicarboxylate/amino acid:cation symporter [Gemmatimonadaceae bacterium]